jgi:creatinine amidohydrolase
MKWQDLTTRELEAIDRATPLFLSIGAVEQHGPHLPLATDS